MPRKRVKIGRQGTTKRQMKLSDLSFSQLRLLINLLKVKTLVKTRGTKAAIMHDAFSTLRYLMYLNDNNISTDIFILSQLLCSNQ